MTMDISSEAVEDRAQCADAWGEVNLAQGRVGQSDDMATLANTLRAQAERIKELEALLRNVVAHATGGKTTGTGLSEEEISDHIIELRIEMFTRGKKEARNEALREAASVAANACLVEPDGGSPTKAEADVCEEAYRRIIALIEGATND